jgi:hypothetical protein
VPVFECSRCNHLTYSATHRLELRCDRCGGERLRVLDDPMSFAEARRHPRLIARGDHAAAVFDDPAEVAGVTAATLRAGVSEGALVQAFLPDALAAPVRASLGDDAAQVAFHRPDELYGTTFDPDAIAERYRSLTNGRTVYVAGCPDRPVRTYATLEAWVRYERMAHEIAVDAGMVVLCLYDRAVFEPPYLAVCEGTHPLLGEETDFRRNDEFAYLPG